MDEDCQSIASIADDEDFEDYDDEQNSGILHQVVQIQNYLHQVAQGRLWNINGVAKFDEEDETPCRGDLDTNWEMLEDNQTHVITGMNLEKVLDNTPRTISVNGSNASSRENETVSAGSLSDFSMLSHKSLTFLSADMSADVSNNMGSKNAKTKLRAITSMLDPKLNSKIKTSRGIWGGNFEEQDSNEESMEVEYGKEPAKKEKRSFTRRKKTDEQVEAPFRLRQRRTVLRLFEC